MTPKLFLLAAALTICGILLGGILSQDKHFSLAALSPKFDRKPFNCKPCLTFHVLWILFLVGACVVHSSSFFALGLVVSMTTFAVLYLELKSKIDK